MTDSVPETRSIATSQYWRGLGLWNLYFFAKFGLIWVGALDFHPLANLAFAAALLCPLPPLWLHRLRHIVAIPLGAALFYYDTWFPPFSRLIAAHNDIAQFSPEYLLELAQRLVNPDMLAAGIILVVACLFFSQWLRLTGISIVALVYLTVVGLQPPVTTIAAAIRPPATVTVATTPAPQALQGAAPQANTIPSPQSLAPTDENLNAYLNAFYAKEAQRKTNFLALASESVPFDLLVLNICSMSWSDLETVHLRDHPLFAKMDIIFDNFNSATSYSGPAAIRLLRASCGQQPHEKLYEPQSPECFLFENLGKLGFTAELALNHTGFYQDYLKNIHDQGNMPAPAVDTSSLSNPLVAFYGTAIWRDLDVLNRWWQQRQAQGTARTALFYNTITLHDGNRAVMANGGTERIGYQPRAQRMLDDLSTFIDELERSGRRAVVAIVPEHGASLNADRMQIEGMREIPSPSITHVPVALKLVGMKQPHSGSPIHVKGPTSYLALSELAARLANGLAFTSADFNWDALVADLPLTDPVAENSGVVVLTYQGTSYVRMNGASWLPYPR